MIAAVPSGLALVLAWIWACHHPALAVIAGITLLLLIVGTVRFCREVAPALCVGSWGTGPSPGALEVPG